MALIKKLFNTNFLEYASYVIKDRAIPHLDDGLKPVQRRILQSLYDVDDGKFHKVANIVGHTMQYHPHGDASIYEALVNLANKDLFIDKQGNFGNTLTGDPASAARYIECRLLPLAKDVLFGPEITHFTESYDGRRKEPVTLPSKIPLPLILGAEGIAVGMSTRILPHNFVEVIEAQQAVLRDEEFELYPDILSGGIIDVSNYEEGNGKILSRARIDTSDKKRIVIRELPFGVTTEQLIESMESAARSNKIKIGTITDYTTENVEIEIHLPRGVHTSDTVDALYAFTDCEVSVAVNLLLITTENQTDVHQTKPRQMTITEVITHHAHKLKQILKAELLLEQTKLQDTIHARTLEKIFIVEKIYKKIEPLKSIPGIFKTIHKGFEPFASELTNPVTDPDIERLLKIPIRRISQFDIDRMEDEIRKLQDRLTEIRKHLKNLVAYALNYLGTILEQYRAQYPRRSTITQFQKIDVQEAARKTLKIKYNPNTGYIGHECTGKVLLDASPYDKILIIKKDGTYRIQDVPEKLFVGKNMLHASLADKETCDNTIYTLIYRHKDNNYPYIKRCKITQFIMNRTYHLVPEEGQLIRLTTKTEVAAIIDFVQKRTATSDNSFPVSNYLIKGTRAKGVRIKPRQFTSARFVSLQTLQKKKQ